MKIAFVLAATLLTTAVMAADVSAPALTTPDGAPKEKKVCHNLDPMIGSNLIRRSCKTPSEWAKQKYVDRPTTKEQVDVEKFRDMSTQYAAPH